MIISKDKAFRTPSDEDINIVMAVCYLLPVTVVNYINTFIKYRLVLTRYLG